ncbi:MAG TPA: hypothetical protein VMB75_02070 [Rhodocyclaceae bacterium]|nr:hypothetical protein [Rhodocyclaceae bacterium]
MNETLVRRLLRTAAWITIAGAVLGLSLEGLALHKALYAANAAGRADMLDSTLTVALFWIFIWLGLPAGAVAFWRFLAWPERLLGLLLPSLAVAGVVAALLLL